MKNWRNNRPLQYVKRLFFPYKIKVFFSFFIAYINIIIYIYIYIFFFYYPN